MGVKQFLALRKERRLKIYEGRVLRRIFKPYLNLW
jgi:hypothetical protein